MAIITMSLDQLESIAAAISLIKGIIGTPAPHDITTEVDCETFSTRQVMQHIQTAIELWQRHLSLSIKGYDQFYGKAEE